MDGNTSSTYYADSDGVYEYEITNDGTLIIQDEDYDTIVMIRNWYKIKINYEEEPEYEPEEAYPTTGLLISEKSFQTVTEKKSIEAKRENPIKK